MTNGVICIDKPIGMTSHDVVNIVRKLYGTRQVGHTGTLDPLATGVLAVMVGRAVKASDYLQCDSKGYSATFLLGKKTDTGDITGEIIQEKKLPLSKEQVDKAVNTFVGKSMQIPPMYSALKVNGQKLVDLARKGINIDRQPREIEISEITLSETDKQDEYRIDVNCSKGTYIRTICEDIGEKLGTVATMTSLRRTKSGLFTLENCHTLSELEKMTQEERYSLLMPVETLFADLRKVDLPPFFEKLARDGQIIYTKKINFVPKEEEKVALYGANGFFAIALTTSKDGETVLKPVKQFDIR